MGRAFWLAPFLPFNELFAANDLLAVYTWSCPHMHVHLSVHVRTNVLASTDKSACR